MAKAEKKPVGVEVEASAIPVPERPAREELPFPRTHWGVKPNVPVTILAGDELLFHGAGLDSVEIKLRGE